ncbi:erythromycin esterase family protein [Chitinophaga qingshengii]|uniref:Erythromycin esterase family protein n=1 Tax=Chitinophaga qingshengii TaxID=1569794 RepID=A0ABR7TU99_9BACT|nr:erythromycin esterase family protein [Chitinophaga qingshengii]MBC9933235.1 erythromycin esterase family protein [Chitinophaga qingshengii]
MLIRKSFRPLMLALAFYSHAASAQAPNIPHAAEIRSIDPADTRYADLEPLRAAIGKSRVVLLGEQTHGEATTFLAKTRLIQFLHEKMGFEVLAFESGLYDCARIWDNTVKGGQLSKEVIGSLFYMYATSQQMQPLFNYIQTQLKTSTPLTLSGFESQHTGEFAKKQLFPDFEQFLQQKHLSLSDSSWALFQRVSLATFNSNAYRPAAAEQTEFFRTLDKLKNSLSRERDKDGHFTTSPGFWLKVTESIESQAKRYWGLVSGNELSVRDKQMAENLIWLAEKAFPGKKIIVWAHNIHIAKNTNTLEDLTGKPIPFLQTFVPMGATVSKHFGKEAYVVGFSGSAGTYIDYGNGNTVNVPPVVPGSVEGRLDTAGYEQAFVNYRTAKGWLQQKQQATMFDFIPLKGIWPDIFDGLFYIHTSTPVDR